MLDIEKVIVIILSSTVLSGIITGIISFIINTRNNRLKYITEDRRTWRKEIRDIVDEIYSIEYPSQIKSTLAKLKVRINPYGKGKKEDYLHDSHIWELIERIEENSHNEFEQNRELLVFYLSVLLKFDWDRTKKEVIGNIKGVILFITFVYGVSFLIYNHFIRCGFGFDQLFITTFALFLFLPTAVAMLTCDGIVNDVKNRIRQQGQKWKNVLMIIISGLTVLFFAICIVLILISTLKSYGITLEYLSSPNAYGNVFSVVTVVGMIWKTIRSSLSNSLSRKYCDYIHENAK